MTLLGIISDTHGLLRPEALHTLRGSELIIHAGDVGKSEILERLREIAPVVAVCGNVDTAKNFLKPRLCALLLDATTTSYMTDPSSSPILSPPAMRQWCSAIHTRC